MILLSEPIYGGQVLEPRLSSGFHSLLVRRLALRVRVKIERTITAKPKASAFALPALRSLGELAGSPPVIVVDTREQDPLPFSRLKSQAGTLVTGNYSVAGLEILFAVERKSISDLVGCCISQNRERFERELHRLRGFRFKRLLIVGSEAELLAGQYRSNVKPAAVLGTLRAFEIRYDVPVVFCETADAAAARVESWAFYFAREIG